MIVYWRNPFKLSSFARVFFCVSSEHQHQKIVYTLFLVICISVVSSFQVSEGLEEKKSMVYKISACGVCVCVRMFWYYRVTALCKSICFPNVVTDFHYVYHRFIVLFIWFLFVYCLFQLSSTLSFDLSSKDMFYRYAGVVLAGRKLVFWPLVASHMWSNKPSVVYAIWSIWCEW